MAAALRRFWSLSSLYHAQRSLSTAVVVNAKSKTPDDPIKKLFLEKLNEFNSKGNVSDFLSLYILLYYVDCYVK